MNIKFCGAAGMVSGSCHYIEAAGKKFLIDCGMFQGLEVEEALNFEPFKFNPAEIDFVLLTHTHIDHTGLLPKLSRAGFKGKVHCHLLTAKIAEFLLLDSAKIHESNLNKFYTNAGQEFNSNDLSIEKVGIMNKDAEFLYSTVDAMNVLSQFVSHEYGDIVPVSEDISVKLVDAGHILGACSFQITIKEEGRTIKVLAAGDVGNPKQGLIGSYDAAHGFKPDYIIMEATYGNRLHDDRLKTVNAFIEVLNDTYKKGGTVVVPSFAAQRTQELLFEIKKAKLFNRLPQAMEVYVDSPLASKITQVYQDNWKYLNAETQMFFQNRDNAFNFQRLAFTRNYKESMMLNKKRGIVVIAGSGMCNGGRVLGHLATNIQNPTTAVVLVGYQAEETLGKELAEGAKEITIDGNKFQVNATIHRLFGFSAHADRNGLMGFFNQYNFDNLKKVFLVHSNQESSDGLKAEIMKVSDTVEVLFPHRFDHIENL